MAIDFSEGPFHFIARVWSDQDMTYDLHIRFNSVEEALSHGDDVLAKSIEKYGDTLRWVGLLGRDEELIRGYAP